MRQCFVIMPIGSGDAYQIYRNRYEHIIEPAIKGLQVAGEQAFQCVRADFVTQTGSITRDLISRLYRAEAVIADLTDLNPNVFYELGVRHALRSGTILIALKGTKPPFDVGDLRVVSYEDRVGGEKEAIPQIQEMLSSLLADQRELDSPVLLAIPDLAELGSVKEQQARLLALEHERDLLKAQLEVSERANLASQGLLEAMRGAIEKLGDQVSQAQRKNAKAKIEAVVQSERRASESLTVPRVGSVPVDPNTVFILMPMSRDLEPLYETIQMAATAAGFRSYRADAILAVGRIIDQIFEAIGRAELIVAVLTARNQNVMYELGLARAMGKEALLLSDDLRDVPFDIRDQRVLSYDMSVQGLKKLQWRLQRAFDGYRRHSA